MRDENDRPGSIGTSPVHADMASDDDDPPAPSVFDGVRSIGEVFGQLTGRGVYAIELLEEVFPRFGFIYERTTDELTYRDQRVVVGSRDAQAVAADMDAVGTGQLADDLEPDERLVHAVAVSEAVFRLMFPGRIPWGRQFAGRDRDRAFAANCAAIRSGDGARTWLH